jgi:hypothetical protein
MARNMRGRTGAGAASASERDRQPDELGTTPLCADLFPRQRRKQEISRERQRPNAQSVLSPERDASWRHRPGAERN